VHLYTCEISDWSALAELPRLHKIIVKSEAIVAPELDSLNALCAPWEEEFCCDPPRKLAPLRLVVIDKRKDYDAKADTGGSPRVWGEDKEMAISEANWFIRQLIASCLHPWHLDVMAEPLAEYERDLDEIQDDDEDDEETFDAEREREEWEYRHQRQLERREYLKRRYHQRIGEELGVEPVAPAPTPAAATPPWKPSPKATTPARNTTSAPISASTSPSPKRPPSFTNATAASPKCSSK
jgi:hypothetical protein